jgi:TonB family protein
MAEAIAKRDAADTIEALSAGFAPIGYIAEMTKQTLIRNGYWVEGLESKAISPEILNQADRVINMSGRPRELAFPDYSKVEDWEIEDPFGGSPEIFQQTFEKIWQRITLLTMRIQFPGSGKRVETDGQTAWRSEFKEEAGVQPAGQAAEAQQQIRDQIWAQVSEAASHPEREASPTLLDRQDGLGEEDLQAAKSFGLEDAVRRAIAEPETAAPLIRSMNPSAESQTSPDRIPDINTKLPPPEEQLISGGLDSAGNARPSSNRRAHSRERVVPPSYISLEDNNGGIILNVSEGGLSLAAAIALPDAHSLNMRFQIPDGRGWIEAKGQIAWRSESGKIAGLRFVALGEEARGQIGKWIRSKVSPGRLQKQPEKIRQAQNLRAASLILGSRARAEAVQEDWPAEPFMPDPVSRLQEARVPVAVSRAPKPAGIPRAKGVLRARSGAKNRRRNIEGLGRQWRRFGTIAGLIVLITFAVGWIARNLNAGNKIPVAVVRQAAVAPGASKSETRSLEKRIAEAPAPGVEKLDIQPQKEESLPAEKLQNSYAPARNLPRQVRGVEHSSPPGIINHPKLPLGKAAAPVQMTKEPRLAAAKVNTPPVLTAQTQRVETLPAPPSQPGGIIASAASPDPGPPKDASPVEPKKKESLSPSPKLPESPVNMTGLVAIHTDPYPSLRIPNERSAKKSSQGKSLRFGHLVSRVEPAYPEEAKQRGIEGTVKLHAIFGRDGAIESLSSISGSPALVPAAMNAVRGWHYSQTLLDNKSVEIEEDIFVEFRLSNSATARN